MTALNRLLARVAEEYPDEDRLPDEAWEVYVTARRFAAEFGYRADQSEVDRMADAVNDAFFFRPYVLLPGDADLDSKVTSTDARLALQIAVGKLLKSDIPGAPDMLDGDGDGSVASTDARLILQRSVGVIKTFPVE